MPLQGAAVLILGLIMDTIFLVGVFFVLLLLSLLVFQKILMTRRAKFINNYEFPKSIRSGVAKTYPHLNDAEIDQVVFGLRKYFHLILLSKRKMIAMPSQVVDIAWHEFILFTREYNQFCSKALGRFLHHTPAEAMKSKKLAQEGIKRAWRIACHLEHINPHLPSRLPEIFALDARLKIEDGFHYERNCMKSETNGSGGAGGSYCGSHIGCTSGCAGSSGGDGCSGDGGCGGGS